MTKASSQQHPIDAVILWVDGNDKKHQAKMLPYVKNKEAIQSKKFRTRFDQVNEIKFTIDSILKYANFINNIYIITDSQTPNFLNTKDTSQTYKNVSIIDHSEIFAGYEKYLPTFNCRPIETCLYRIPNLAEHFIYFNDDFFLINNTEPNDFFINGVPVLRGKWRKFDKDKITKRFKKVKVRHKTAQQKAAQILGFDNYYNFRHTPHPLRKSTFDNFFKENENVLIENIKHRFRNQNQFTPQGLANHLEIKNSTCEFKDDLQLMYIRSYKKPLFWYRYKLNKMDKRKLFLGLQSLDQCPPNILNYILKWLNKRVN